MARSRGAAVDVAGIGRQSADVSLEPLPESCAVAIVDWHCAGHDTARGELELAPTHEVVVPRHGAYLREYRGELSWLDPGTVSFANPGEHYRELIAEFGTPHYTRIDAPATPALKARLGSLSPEAVSASCQIHLQRQAFRSFNGRR